MDIAFALVLVALGILAAVFIYRAGLSYFFVAGTIVAGLVLGGAVYYFWPDGTVTKVQCTDGSEAKTLDDCPKPIAAANGSPTTNIPIPDLKGKTLAEAISALNSAGFMTTFASEANQLAVGIVTRTDPTGSAPKGANVVIYVSSGSGQANPPAQATANSGPAQAQTTPTPGSGVIAPKGQNPFAGRAYASSLGDSSNPTADPYYGKWYGKRFYEPTIPPEGQRQPFTLVFDIPAGKWYAKTAACTIDVDGTVVADHQNQTADTGFETTQNGTATAVCDGTFNPGFSIEPAG